MSHTKYNTFCPHLPPIIPSSLLLFALIFCIPNFVTSASAATTNISVVVDSVPAVWTDASPYINAEWRTMVPLRAAANAMDMDVTYDATTNTAIFTKTYANAAECPARYQDGGSYATSVRVEFPIGQSVCYITTEGFSYRETVPMDTVATSLNGRSYAPICYLAEAAGYTVAWNGDTQTVSLTSAGRTRFASPSEPLIACDNDIEELSEYFFGAFNANLTSFSVLYPQRYSFDDIAAFASKAYNKFFYDYPEYANYTSTPTLRARVTADGLLCEFLVDEFDIGYAERDEAFAAGASFLSNLYQSGRLNTSMSEYARAEVIFHALRDVVSYKKVEDKTDMTAWSAFKLHSGVCMGYTAAYNMLLKLDGIAEVRGQAGTMKGVDHIWTVATLDGVEYHIDATLHAKDYFGLTAEEIAKDHVFGEVFQ